MSDFIVTFKDTSREVIDRLFVKEMIEDLYDIEKKLADYCMDRECESCMMIDECPIKILSASFSRSVKELCEKCEHYIY